MKRFNRLILWVVLSGLAGIAAFAGYALSPLRTEHSKAYRIEVNRILHQASQQEGAAFPLMFNASDYSYIRSMSWMDKDAEPLAIQRFFDGSGVKDSEEYIVKPIYLDERLSGFLRFSYEDGSSYIRGTVVLIVILLLILAAVAGLLLYVRAQIIRPFHKIEELPYELSKGHLNPGMKESKSRFFGKFIWGLDLLRQTLDTQRQTNHRLEKDRQTLVASLSHELKTPVAAIKLYSSALSDGLYESETRRRDCARMIGQKAEQIEHLIASIITTSVSSLQEVEIQSSEFYIRDWLQRAVYNHKERLDLLKIRLEIGDYQNKLLLGDPDKLLEVLDNIIENAIKYGDGTRIGITFEVEDFRQLIRIENSGVPVMANELPYIFSSFWRGSNAGDKQGNGLGLFICKQLLQKMGGDIFAEASGRGMSFVLVLRY